MRPLPFLHAVVRSKTRADKVFRGWRASRQELWDIYRKSPTTHYWRLARAHAHEDLDLAANMAVERYEKGEARQRAKFEVILRQEAAYL